MSQATDKEKKSSSRKLLRESLKSENTIYNKVLLALLDNNQGKLEDIFLGSFTNRPFVIDKSSKKDAFRLIEELAKLRDSAIKEFVVANANKKSNISENSRKKAHLYQYALLLLLYSFIKNNLLSELITDKNYYKNNPLLNKIGGVDYILYVPPSPPKFSIGYPSFNLLENLLYSSSLHQVSPRDLDIIVYAFARCGIKFEPREEIDPKSVGWNAQLAATQARASEIYMKNLARTQLFEHGEPAAQGPSRVGEEKESDKKKASAAEALPMETGGFAASVRKL